jgi:hypothetical protein
MGTSQQRKRGCTKSIVQDLIVIFKQFKEYIRLVIAVGGVDTVDNLSKPQDMGMPAPPLAGCGADSIRKAFPRLWMDSAKSIHSPSTEKGDF